MSARAKDATTLLSAQMPDLDTALLVLVHGSPTAGAYDPMLRVVEEVRARGIFRVVEVGYMECNTPTIADAADACAASGCTRVVAVPFFLHMGAHVSSDLPDALDKARARHPEVAFLMGEFLGLSPKVTEILADRARAAVT